MATNHLFFFKFLKFWDIFKSPTVLLIISANFNRRNLLCTKYSHCISKHFTAEKNLLEQNDRKYSLFGAFIF